LTTNATLRANSYPHIALRQYVWLKAKGTLKGGGDYSKTFWQPPGSQTNATWIDQGFYTHTFPLPDLQSLEDGRDLELEFKAGFGGSQVETEAVTFARRTYRIKAYENVVPTLDSVKGSPSGDEIPHGGLTVETAVTLSGVAAKGQKVDVLDGTTSKGQPDADVTTGNWTLRISGLSVKTYSFTAKPLYGAGLPSSPERTMQVVAKLTINSRKMDLNGFSVKIPEWPKTGRDSVGNTGSRQPQGGVSPYNYRSSKSDIASVNQQGKVTGNRIGEATIFVTDQMQNEVSYPVSVTNVWSLVVNEVKMGPLESIDWMNSIGGTSSMKFKFNEDISLVYTVPLPRVEPIWLCAETSQTPGKFWYLVRERNDNGYIAAGPLFKWGAWCLKPLH